MLFINREQRSLLIPKHINVAGPIKLTLKHNLTGVEYVFDNLPNSDITMLFWTFDNLDFSKLQVGEYTYFLNDIETGLLQVETPTSEPISYNVEKTVIQYGDR